MAQSDQTSIMTAYAAVYTFKTDTETWTSKVEGYSRIDVYFDASRASRIVGVSVSGDNKLEVSLNVPIFKEMIYHKTQSNFHQFADKNTLWGLRFINDDEADRFSKCVQDLLDGRPAQSFQTTTWASAQRGRDENALPSDSEDRSRTGSSGARDRIFSTPVTSTATAGDLASTAAPATQPNTSTGGFITSQRFEPAKPRAKMLGANREMSPHPHLHQQHVLATTSTIPAASTIIQDVDSTNLANDVTAVVTSGTNVTSESIRLGSRMSAPGVHHITQARGANASNSVAKSPLGSIGSTGTSPMGSKQSTPNLSINPPGPLLVSPVSVSSTGTTTPSSASGSGPVSPVPKQLIFRSGHTEGSSPGSGTSTPPLSAVPRGNPALAALPPPPPSPDVDRKDVHALLKMKRQDSVQFPQPLASPPSAGAALITSHSHSHGSPSSVADAIVDSTHPPSSSTNASPRITATSVTSSPRPSPLHSSPLTDANAYISTSPSSATSGTNLLAIGRLELSRSPASTSSTPSPYSPQGLFGNSQQIHSGGGNSSPRIPSSPKSKPNSVYSSASSSSSNSANSSSNTLPQPPTLSAPPPITAKLSPVPRMPPPPIVKNVLPAVAPPQLSPPRSPIHPYPTSREQQYMLIPPPTVSISTPASLSGSSAGSSGTGSTNPSPLSSQTISVNLSGSPMASDSPSLANTPARSASPYVTIRGPGASPVPPPPLGNEVTNRRKSNRTSDGLGIGSMMSRTTAVNSATIRAGAPPSMSTPGTSLALEKFEIPDDTSRHLVRLDPSAPHCQLLRVALERLEEVFPQAGKLSNATLNALPRLFRRAVEYLELEAPGIERVFGYEYLERLDRLERLKIFIDKEQADLRTAASAREQTVQLVAELLKRFCRDFPAGLINLDSYEPLLAFVDCADDFSRLKYVQELANSLPSQNRAILELLLSLLSKVASNAHITQMDAGRLAAVFAPLCYRYQLIYYKKPVPIPLRVPIQW